MKPGVTNLKKIDFKNEKIKGEKIKDKKLLIINVSLNDEYSEKLKELTINNLTKEKMYSFKNFLYFVGKGVVEKHDTFFLNCYNNIVSKNYIINVIDYLKMYTDNLEVKINVLACPKIISYVDYLLYCAKENKLRVEKSMGDIYKLPIKNFIKKTNDLHSNIKDIVLGGIFDNLLIYKLDGNRIGDGVLSIDKDDIDYNLEEKPLIKFNEIKKYIDIELKRSLNNDEQELVNKEINKIKQNYFTVLDKIAC